MTKLKKLVAQDVIAMTNEDWQARKKHYNSERLDENQAFAPDACFDMNGMTEEEFLASMGAIELNNYFQNNMPKWNHS